MLASDPESRTRILLALLPVEPQWADELTDRLLSCGDPAEHRVIREALRDRWQEITPKLRKVLDEPQSDDLARRTRASAAMIALDRPATPDARAWSELRLAPDPGPSALRPRFAARAAAGRRREYQQQE
jgi:hypothetical protein